MEKSPRSGTTTIFVVHKQKPLNKIVQTLVRSVTAISQQFALEVKLIMRMVTEHDITCMGHVIAFPIHNASIGELYVSAVT